MTKSTIPFDRTRARAARRGAMRDDAPSKAPREDYVVVDLPLELTDLPGDALKFEDLDTRTPKLRTIDGARYVGRYELTCGEQLVVGFDGDDALEARVLAKTEPAIEIHRRRRRGRRRASRAAI